MRLPSVWLYDLYETVRPKERYYPEVRDRYVSVPSPAGTPKVYLDLTDRVNGYRFFRIVNGVRVFAYAGELEGGSTVLVGHGKGVMIPECHPYSNWWSFWTAPFVLIGWLVFALLSWIEHLYYWPFVESWNDRRERMERFVVLDESLQRCINPNAAVVFCSYTPGVYTDDIPGGREEHYISFVENAWHRYQLLELVPRVQMLPPRFGWFWRPKTLHRMAGAIRVAVTVFGVVNGWCLVHWLSFVIHSESFELFYDYWTNVNMTLHSHRPSLLVVLLLVGHATMAIAWQWWL